MFTVIPPIFVGDTKIIYDYNFVAPLRQIGFQQNMKTHYITSAFVRRELHYADELSVELSISLS